MNPRELGHQRRRSAAGTRHDPARCTPREGRPDDGDGEHQRLLHRAARRLHIQVAGRHLAERAVADRTASTCSDLPAGRRLRWQGYSTELAVSTTAEILIEAIAGYRDLVENSRASGRPSGLTASCPRASRARSPTPGTHHHPVGLNFAWVQDPSHDPHTRARRTSSRNLTRKLAVLAPAPRPAPGITNRLPPADARGRHHPTRQLATIIQLRVRVARPPFPHARVAEESDHLPRLSGFVKTFGKTADAFPSAGAVQSFVPIARNAEGLTAPEEISLEKAGSA